MHIGSASKFLVLIAKGDSDFFSRETGGVILLHKTSTMTVGNSDLTEFTIIF